ncbi:MAG: phosphoribosyltransferase family protein [Candidatus Paceibacterota bacterium]
MNRNYPQHILKFVMDAVFPIRCIDCGVFESYFCNSCLAGVKIKNDSEIVGQVHLFSVAGYGGKNIEKAIKIFKYGFVKDMAEPLVELVRIYIDLISAHNLNVFRNNPVLIPVPLHKKRLNWRGFNQSEILADNIAHIYNLETRRDILIRNKNTEPQAEIKDKETRLVNVKDSFDCSENLKGRNIVLIDDLCTTGATLNECAKALAAKGAGKIRALVVARG